MSFYFKHNTDIYISTGSNITADNTNTVKLNIKNFSYNRSSNSRDISRNTIDPTQDRSVEPTVISLAPVSFTFETYINPLLDTNVTSPEENLWVSLVGIASAITSNSASSTIDFASGNVQELQNLTLWFDNPLQTEGNFRLDNAIIDSASISFGLNEIAFIKWTGRALGINADNTPPAFTDRTTAAPNYLKNKLSTITLSTLTPSAVNYTLALIGGSMTVNNNNTFYGRNKLGEVTVPTGSYTGKRTIKGTLNFYMKSGTNDSVDLYTTILNNISSSTYENDYKTDISINIGGSSTPNIQVNLPRVVLEIGAQNFADVISVSIPFTAREGIGFYSTIIYNI